VDSITQDLEIPAGVLSEQVASVLAEICTYPSVEVCEMADGLDARGNHDRLTHTRLHMERHSRAGRLARLYFVDFRLAPPHADWDGWRRFSVVDTAGNPAIFVDRGRVSGKLSLASWRWDEDLSTLAFDEMVKRVRWFANRVRDELARM